MEPDGKDGGAIIIHKTGGAIIHETFFLPEAFDAEGLDLSLNGRAEEPANWPKPSRPGTNLGGANGPHAAGDGSLALLFFPCPVSAAVAVPARARASSAALVNCPSFAALSSGSSWPNIFLALPKNAAGVPMSTKSLSTSSVSSLHSGAAAC